MVKIAKVTVKNKMSRFLWFTVYITLASLERFFCERELTFTFTFTFAIYAIARLFVTLVYTYKDVHSQFRIIWCTYPSSD